MIKPNRETILVIGGAGYIGSHMVKLLVEKGYHPVVLDNLSTGHRELVTVNQFVNGSLGDSSLLDTVFEQNDIHAVMHFAAFSLVGESVQLPLHYYRNNVVETAILIEAMVRHNIKRFIFSSTAAVYGEPEVVPINEDHPRRPTNPYGNTKLCVERMLADCDAAYGLKSICLRYFNAAGAHPSGTIGEMHQPESHLIPLILKSALSSSPVRIFGTDYPTQDGTCVRDYVHVCDLAQAHLSALEALDNNAASAAYNLGNSVGYSVRQVIDAARQVSGRKIDTVECERRAGDPAALVAASEKVRRELHWAPQFEQLETIIETAWKWHSKQ